jgi:tripartite ATP-independent transporter DctM subunit
METSLIGFAVLLGLILLRMPIAFAMGIVGFVGLWIIKDWNVALATGAERFVSSVQNYELSVLPMFILMGNLVARAGVSRELYDAAQTFLGHRKGGLAMATVVACGGFAAICGSSLATAATMSKVAMPSMRQYKYKDTLATASIAAGGTLGIMIPPSTIMVIYGIMTETSINQLFSAGFLPGLLGVVFYMLAVRYMVWRDPAAGPAAERVGWGERRRALSQVWGVVSLFLLVIVGIYGGLFTPTEAAGVGAGGALLLAFVKRVPLRALVDVFIDSARTSAVLFFILIGALIFSNFVNTAGMPAALRGLVAESGLSPWLVIVVILVIYIVLGCILESLSMILLTVPIFFPLVQSLAPGLGIEPKWVLVWFGIIIVMVTEISLITPPVGLNVYVLASVLPGVKTTTIFRGMMPFIGADFLRLSAITFVPAVALLMPRDVPIWVKALAAWVQRLF